MRKFYDSKPPLISSHFMAIALKLGERNKTLNISHVNDFNVDTVQEQINDALCMR